MKNGNMYDFIGKDTWNPLAGECQHRCSYCYVNAMKFRPAIKAKYSGEIRLDEKAFKSLGHGKTWFVCSCNDLFAENVPDWMIIRILEHCRKYDNIYLFQTKNPEKYRYFLGLYPNKSIFCITLESNLYQLPMGHAPDPAFRTFSIPDIDCLPRMITVEPIMKFGLHQFSRWIINMHPTQVNIGANSNKAINLPEPTMDEVRALIKALQDKGIKVHLKSNLKRLLPEME